MEKAASLAALACGRVRRGRGRGRADQHQQPLIAAGAAYLAADGASAGATLAAAASAAAALAAASAAAAAHAAATAAIDAAASSIRLGAGYGCGRTGRSGLGHRRVSQKVPAANPAVAIRSCIRCRRRCRRC